jgi:hypothetical protein
VVVSNGCTDSVPIAGTVPRPWSIETLFDPVTDHRNTADWPRATVVGSTANDAITGRPACGAAGAPAFVDGAGGGGGGIGVFLLPQADAKTIDASARDSAKLNDAQFERSEDSG